VHIGEVPTKVTHAIAVPKTMLRVFLGIDVAILVNWLTPGEKFNRGYFCEKYSNRFPRSCTAGALPRPQGRQCILIMLLLIDQLQLNIVFNFANSDVLPSHTTARISVRVTSFYSAI
jgi:hypothetical protein